MKDLASRLTILSGPAFVDSSDALCDFSVDTATITLLSTDYLYVGFEKPISSLFFYLTTVSTGTRALKVEMFNNGTWNTQKSIDDTSGLTRSGFVTWEIPNQPIVCNVNSTSMFWVRFSVTVSTSATVFRAISSLFSDDRELKKEFPSILNTNFLIGGSTDHYMIHETCRNDIVQYFRKKGLRRLGQDCFMKKFMAFDIMDIDEVRTAATYLALSKIFSNVANSANAEDNWSAKSKMYKKMTDEALNTAYLTWDALSDGAKNSQSQIANITLHR